LLLVQGTAVLDYLDCLVAERVNEIRWICPSRNRIRLRQKSKERKSAGREKMAREIPRMLQVGDMPGPSSVRLAKDVTTKGSLTFGCIAK